MIVARATGTDVSVGDPETMCASIGAGHDLQSHYLDAHCLHCLHTHTAVQAAVVTQQRLRLLRTAGASAASMGACRDRGLRDGCASGRWRRSARQAVCGARRSSRCARHTAAARWCIVEHGALAARGFPPARLPRGLWYSLADSVLASSRE